jgi:hypothetical protein
VCFLIDRPIHSSAAPQPLDSCDELSRIGQQGGRFGRGLAVSESLAQTRERAVA